jgi:hypothetical protein
LNAKTRIIEKPDFSNKYVFKGYWVSETALKSKATTAYRQGIFYMPLALYIG